jgi:NTE family protein
MTCAPTSSCVYKGHINARGKAMHPRDRIAIVLSGGGAKGAFQVGVMDYLIRTRSLDARIFGGVSTGSIQAVGGAQNDIDKLMAVWTSIRGPDDIYKKRFGGLLLSSIFGKDSLYKPDALRAKLTTFIDPARLRSSGKSLVIGAVGLQKADFRVIRETDPDIVDAVMASAAVPLAFPPVVQSGQQWVDGGVLNVTPLDAVMELNPSAVIVVLASPLFTPARNRKFDNLIDIAKRATSIMSDEVTREDLKRAGFITDLLQAKKDLCDALDASGLPQQTQDQILAPITSILARYRAVPIITIEPPVYYSDSLEFDPSKIAAAIAGGQQTATARWPDIDWQILNPPPSRSFIV